MSLTLLDLGAAKYAAPAAAVAWESTLPPAEQAFVQKVLKGARGLPRRGTLLFDWDLTLVGANGRLREGAQELMERLRTERPDLVLGVLTSRKEHNMEDVRRLAGQLGIRGPLYQHEHQAATSSRPDTAELAKMTGMKKSEIEARIGSVRTQNKLSFLTHEFKGRLNTVHVVDDGDCGKVGQDLGIATLVDAPACSIRASALV
jgi:hypothetical protein